MIESFYLWLYLQHGQPIWAECSTIEISVWRETEWDLIQGIHAITNEQIGSSQQKKKSNCSHEIIFNYNIKAFQQECWKPYVPPDVTPGGSSHEEVWTGLQWLPRYLRTCTVRSNASWVMVAWDLPPHPRPPPDRVTDRYLWKHYLPTTSLVGGKYENEKCAHIYKLCQCK